MTPDFDAIRARHVRAPTLTLDGWGGCDEDDQPWPCDFIQADDARRRLVEAARFPRNHTFTGDDIARFDGLWTAVPREDFVALRAALAESES